MAEYCNKLCEEGHGNEKVMLHLDKCVSKAEVKDVMYDDSKLIVEMDDDLSRLLSDAPSSIIKDILYWRDDDVELEHDIVNTYMENMDSDEKALLVKQWVQEIL